MREIKFRAWDKLNNKIINNIHNTMHIPGNGLNPGIAATFGYWLDNKKRYEIMQYTGLKDKNEKEIYEGDLLTDKHNIFEVFFSEGSYLVRHIDNNGFLSGDDLCCYNNDIEIIGNIYENQELING